jgi:tetratricopeptide (TPR) repeat protein/TolB-like protein
MGEVYEAHDLELGHRVAIKTLRSDLASSREHARAFKREVLLARQVTHPNICRIFDLFSHTSTRPDQSDTVAIPFFSMELLQGETLARCLQRSGPMSSDQALPIISQLIDALDAAHRADVLHLDLKAGNIMLVPEDGTSRAVVTDFGMALACDPDSNQAGARSSPGGTPAYMAPERWCRGPVTAATDIYSLGVVLYRMVTGELPYDRPDAGKQQRPRPPRELAPELDPTLETVILRCLEPDHEDRYSRAREISAKLGQAGMSWLQRWWQRCRSRVVVTAAALLALVVAMSLFAWQLSARRETGWIQSTLTGAESRQRRAVAVIGFKNLAGTADCEWISGALVEMLTTELAGGGQLRMIPSESVTRARIDLDLPKAETFTTGTLQRVQSVLGAELIVLGSYLSRSDGEERVLRLDLRVQATGSGEILAVVAETGKEDQLVEIVATAGHRLRTALGISQLSAVEADALRASQPFSAGAARLYAESLDRLRRFDLKEAVALLQQVTAAEPEFPLAHLALADAWGALGYEGKARVEIETAFSLAPGLPREARLLIEARYHAAHYEWDRAVQLYQALWTFYPDSLEYGLRLAEIQTAAGQGKAALVTIDQLRKLPMPFSEDPRIDLQETAAAVSVSEYRRQLAAARRAVDKAGSRAAAQILADARRAEADALWRLGDYDEAMVVQKDARRLSATIGDLRGVAESTICIGSQRRTAGDLDGAERYFNEALGISRKIGDRAGIAVAQLMLGGLSKVRGDLREARDSLEQALEIYQETGARGIADTLNSLGTVAEAMGDPPGARQYYEQAMQEYESVGSVKGVSLMLNNLAIAMTRQGDYLGALDKLRRSHELSQQLGDRSGAGLAQMNIGIIQCRLGQTDQGKELLLEASRVLAETGNQLYIAAVNQRLGEASEIAGELELAGEHYARALAVFQLHRNRAAVAEVQILSARLSLKKGSPREAERLAREALAAYEEKSMDHGRAEACAILARSLSDQGQVSEAAAAARQALALSETMPFRRRLQVVLGSAQALGRDDPSGQAVVLAESVRAEAAAKELQTLALEARLLLHRQQLHSDRTGARLRLAELSQQARALGLGWIASQAALPVPTRSRTDPHFASVSGMGVR